MWIGKDDVNIILKNDKTCKEKIKGVSGDTEVEIVDLMAAYPNRNGSGAPTAFYYAIEEVYDKWEKFAE